MYPKIKKIEFRAPKTGFKNFSLKQTGSFECELSHAEVKSIKYYRKTTKNDQKKIQFFLTFSKKLVRSDQNSSFCISSCTRCSKILKSRILGHPPMADMDPGPTKTCLWKLQSIFYNALFERV